MPQSKKTTILRASLVSAVGTALSRVMGALRDIVLANVYGATMHSDVFFIAWTVPSVFRRFVADEGLTGALIPAVAQAEKAQGEKEAKRLANTTLTALLLAGLILCTLGILGAEWLVDLFAHGFRRDPEKFALTVQMTRWLFPFVVFVSLVSFCEGLLNHRGHFFVPKIAPGIVAGSIAACALLLVNHFEQKVFAAVIGALVGGLVHLLICIPVLIRRFGMVRPALHFNTPRFRSFAREMGKVVAIGLLAQINLVILKYLASLLEEGAVTHYWFANRIVDLAQGAIAVGVGSALLPVISKDAADGNWTLFRSHFKEALLLAAVFLVPAAACLFVLAEPMVAVLFRHGEFDAQSLTITAETLRFLVPFMLALAGINIVKKVYFALDARTSLMVVGAVGIGVTAWAGYSLSKLMGVQGLGLGLSISAVIQLLAYLLILRSKSDVQLGLAETLWPLIKITLVAAPAGLVAWWISTYGHWSQGPSLPNIANLAAAGSAAIVVYLYLGWVMRVEPLRSLLRRLVKKRPNQSPS